MKSLLHKDVVESIIPQKAPFVMVDTLFAFTSYNIVAGFTIQSSNIFVEAGRFTESGIVEHMAQSVALYTGYQYYLKNEPAPTGYIGSIKDVVVLSLPPAGGELITTATILQEFMGITLVDIVTKCNSIQIASAQMKTVVAK